MNPHPLAATLSILAGCTGTPSIDEVAKQTLTTTIRTAISVQHDTGDTWDEAATTAIRKLPGGGRELALSDGVITYQTDELCYGAWLVNLNEIRVKPCLEIDWGSERLWPGGRTDCFTTEKDRP